MSGSRSTVQGFNPISCIRERVLKTRLLLLRIVARRPKMFKQAQKIRELMTA